MIRAAGMVSSSFRWVWLSACAVVVLALAAAAGASVVRALQRLSASPAELSWALAGVLLAVLAIVFHRRVAARWSPRRFLTTVVIATAVVRFALPVLLPQYAQLADRLFLQRFVEAVVDHGGGEAAYAPLGTQHDYPLWCGRSWPQHLLLYHWFGSRHVLAQQMLNILLSLALLPVAYAIGRRVGGDAAGRIAVWLLVLNPLQTFMVLDYTYQYQGALLVALVVLQAMRLADAPGWRWPVLALHATGLAAALALLNLQRGLDLLAYAILGAALLPVALRSAPATTLRIALFGLVLPVLAARVLVAPVNADFSRYDPHHLYSHAVAQAGIGLNLETGGEFLGRLVQIDELTPDAEGGAFLARMLITQLRDAPVETVAVLPVIKLVKYLQIGAASGLEEGLAAGGHAVAAACFRGLRLSYAPLLLLMAGWGVWRMARSVRSEAGWVIATTLAGCFVIYALMNQTSPRYSIYLHAVLAAAAGMALARVPAEGRGGSRPLGTAAAGLLAAYGAVALAAVLLCRGPLAHRGFLCLAPAPAGWKLGQAASGLWLFPLPRANGAGESHVFTLAVPTVSIPPGSRVTGYLWPDGGRIADVRMEDSGTSSPVVRRSIPSGVERFEVKPPALTSGPALTLRIAVSPAIGGDAPSVSAGYVAVSPARFSPTAKIDTPHGKLPARSQ